MSGHHHHHQNHHHHDVSSGLTRALVIGIGLNFAFVIVEALAGLWLSSLALLTDAGHNLGDVAGLVLVYIAAQLAKKKPTSKFTYGFGKSTVLAALFNSSLLFVAVGAIGWEAFHRLSDPHVVDGKYISIVAVMGILVNAATAFLFMKDRKKDINVQGAFLHMALDALVSAGVVVSGIVILYTGWYWVDAATSLVVCIVIVVSIWGLMKDSMRLSLDGVPSTIDTDKIKKYLLSVNGVIGYHDLHIWALSTNATAMTVHLVIPKGMDDQLLAKINHELHEHFQIDHTTIQVEQEGDENCEQDC